MKKCIICGSVAQCSELDGLVIGEDDLLIAADGGYDILTEAGYKPDILIGDLDSLKCKPIDVEIKKFEVRKDDIDTILCVKHGIERGYRSFVLYGVIGGRLDHTIASVQTLAYIVSRGCEGEIRGRQYLTILNNSSISFDETSRGKISVFSYSPLCEGVCESGLDYTISDARLDYSFPLGVSNEFIGKRATVSVKKGLLLVICEDEKQIKVIKNEK